MHGLLLYVSTGLNREARTGRYLRQIRRLRRIPGSGPDKSAGPPPSPSTDKFQCGPCSLEAIRRGEVGFGHDTTFLFSEVNADLVHWIEDEQSDWGFSKMKSDNYQSVRYAALKRAQLNLGSLQEAD